MSDQCNHCDKESFRRVIETVEENTVEMSYEDEEDEFDTDVDGGIVETAESIEYRAPVGPNIVVTKSESRDEKGRTLESAISVKPRNPSNRITMTRGRNQFTGRKRTGQTALRDSFRKLQLSFKGKPKPSGIKTEILKCTNTLDQLNEKSSKSALLSSSYPMFSAGGVVQKRLNSARQIQINDLMSKVRFLENTIEDVKVENRTLRTVHHRQDVALRKYEGADADLPKMLRHHRSEVHCLQTNLRKVNARTRSYEEEMRQQNQKIIKLEGENKRLTLLVEEGNFEERHDIREQLNAMTFHARISEEKLLDFNRHLQILEKNHLHQISVENGKLRNSNKKLFDSNQEIVRLQDLVKQKDRIINYLRMRACRNPDMESPLLKKMLQCQSELMQKPPYEYIPTPVSRPETPRNIQKCLAETYRRAHSLIQPKRTPYHYHYEQEEKQLDHGHSPREYPENSPRYSYDSGRSGRSLAKDSVSGSIEEPSNPVSQRQDPSEDEEEEAAENSSEDEAPASSNEIQNDKNSPKDSLFSKSIGNLDPDDLEQYYRFDPVDVDELSVCAPNKSLYLDALESSCNVSSLNSPQEKLSPKRDDDNDAKILEPMKSPIDGEGDSVTSIMTTKTEKDTNPKKTLDQQNEMGAAGDASGSLTEINKKIEPPIHTKPKQHVVFATRTEPGYISQQNLVEIVPSAEKVRQAQLKAAEWGRTTRDEEVSATSEDDDDKDNDDDEDQTEKEEEDLDGRIGDMKIHFRLPLPNLPVNNNRETADPMKDAALDNIFKELKSKQEQEQFQFPKHKNTAFSSHFPGGSTPKFELPNPTQSSNSKITKRDYVPMQESPKKTGFAALESPFFQLNSAKSQTSNNANGKSFFPNMPSPTSTTQQHFDFELASIFQKPPAAHLLKKEKSEEHGLSNLTRTSEVPKRDYHDHLTNSFRQKNLPQQQSQAAQHNPNRKDSKEKVSSLKSNHGAWK